jgi:hypothetical protein
MLFKWVDVDLGCGSIFAVSVMSVWQGMTMDSLKFHLGLPYPSLLRPAGRPPQERPYALPPLWTPHALHLSYGVSIKKVAPQKEKLVVGGSWVNSIIRGTMFKISNTNS